MMRTTIAGAVLALAGCAGGLPDLKLPSFGANPAPVQKLAMFGGAVTATGPEGFCADPSASRPAKGFAIFAPCGTLGVDDAPRAINAVTTVQIGAAGSAIVEADPAAFAAVLEGPSGPEILARTKDADTVTVSSVQHSDAHVSVFFTDEASAFIDGAQEAEWRSFLDLNGRLATVSVRGLDEAPLSQSSGATLLEQAITALIAANTQSDS